MTKLYLHQLTESEAISLLGGIYEHSPWVAESLVKEGLTEADSESLHLAKRMQNIVDSASNGQKLLLLQAHPQLANKLSSVGELTQESACEQAAAGLDVCNEDYLAEFAELNNDYLIRFGHPFIIAVRGLSPPDVLRAFRIRIHNDKEKEFLLAIAEVHKIARFRIQDLLD